MLFEAIGGGSSARLVSKWLQRVWLLIWFAPGEGIFGFAGHLEFQIG